MQPMKARSATAIEEELLRLMNLSFGRAAVHSAPTFVAIGAIR
jgi:hypothetical protein